MPNIRDLGISSIPATARPAEAGDRQTQWYLGESTCNPTNQPGCNPTNQPGCNPTNAPGCNPTDGPPCNPTNQPGCNPTNKPGCNPTNKQPCETTTQTRSRYPSIPMEAVAQLKSQLRQHISTDLRN